MGISRFYTDEVLELQLNATIMADQAGFKRDSYQTARIECEAFRACESFVIDGFGAKSICPALITREDFQLNPQNLEVESHFELRLTHQPWRDHCFVSDTPCPHLLQCFGGCRYLSVSEGNDWRTINCERPFFDAMAKYELELWSSGR